MAVVPETAKRVRAAVAYYGPRSDSAVAKGVGTSVRTLQRWKVLGLEAMTVTEVRKLAAFCGLEPDFFTADFTRLREIVPEDVPLLATRDATRPAPPSHTPLPGDTEDRRRGSEGA